jgi:hypothetical protein
MPGPRTVTSVWLFELMPCSFAVPPTVACHGRVRLARHREAAEAQLDVGTPELNTWGAGDCACHITDESAVFPDCPRARDQSADVLGCRGTGRSSSAAATRQGHVQNLAVRISPFLCHDKRLAPARLIHPRTRLLNRFSVAARNNLFNCGTGKALSAGRLGFLLVRAACEYGLG